MVLIKIATVFLLALTVGAEKKIELQDIEEDNLKSEKETEGYQNKSDERTQFTSAGSLQGIPQLELLKNNLLRYLANQSPTHQAQQQRYVHQYAVTESPERSTSVAAVQYSPPSAPQQAMVGYLSNLPMQVYIVPQYYSDLTHQHFNHQSPHASSQYQSPDAAREPTYHESPEPVQTQNNYIEVPAYVTPTVKTYVQQNAPPVAYVGYQAHPTVAPTQTSVVTYQVPVIQYTPAVAQPTAAPKPYHSHSQYTENNSVDEAQEHEHEQRQYSTQTEVPYHKPIADFPRHYNSRVPIRGEYSPVRVNSITELPHPNPILLRGTPAHLAHIPKALPAYRPLAKAVYQGGHISNAYNSRPHEAYSPPFKRRPTSLLDSYIPSSIQVEYLKRGLVKEPGAVYDALASGRIPHLLPRQYERGFLPNQMYHTGAGGVTYGHYKRTPKVDKQ